MKYDVRLTEKNVGFLTVDAPTEAEAEDQAMDKYLNGETNWDGTYLDFEVQGQKVPGDGNAGN